MLSVTAAPISEKEAFRVAELFCKRKGLRGNLELSSLKRKGCYLFNIDDKGYVIVASDDNANPILGYSMNGALREDLNLAPGFVDWMDDIERNDTILKLFPQNVKNRAKYSVRSASDTFTSDFLVEVKPLITTRWDQGAPANLFCPDSSLAGCAPIAMAQIMHYYDSLSNSTATIPAYSTAKIGYKIDSIFVDSSSFAWDIMLESYDGSYSREQAEAMAKLVYYCGVAAKTDYDKKSSYTSVGEVLRAMRDIFGYHKDIKKVNWYVDRMSVKEWTNMLKEQLSLGNPVFYSSTGPDIGHAFICDGYDENGLFHFNFGWGGLCDGYYSIDNLVAKDSTANLIEFDLSSKHSAIINLFPSKYVSKFDLFLTHTAFSIDSLDRNKINFDYTIENRGSQLFRGQVVWKVFNEKGEDALLFCDTIRLINNDSFSDKISISFTVDTVVTLKFVPKVIEKNKGYEMMVDEGCYCEIRYAKLPDGRSKIILLDKYIEEEEEIEKEEQLAYYEGSQSESTGELSVFSGNEDGLFISKIDGCIVFYSSSPREISIYDLWGRLVKQLVVEGESSVNLPKGVYVVGYDNLFRKLVF